jgi:hypothetical protein
MNTTINFKPTFSCFFISITFIMACFFFLACEDDDPIPPAPPVEEVEERPDPINDMFAYLSSSLGVLMVDPDYVEKAIELLELAPTSDGRYEYWETLPNGEVVSFYFDLEIIPIPDLYFAAKYDMEALDRPHFQDGVWKRSFKNAKCGTTVKAGSTGQCTELAAIDPTTGAIARQHQVGDENYYHCIKGKENEECSERLRTVGQTHFYDRLCKDNETAAGQQVGTSLPYQQYTCTKD